MADLRRQLAEVEAQADRLRQQIEHGTCQEVGHRWKCIGGRNAGCSLGDDCTCSVDVHECSKCGDADYGDTDEADEVRLTCTKADDIAGHDALEREMWRLVD